MGDMMTAQLNCLIQEKEIKYVNNVSLFLLFQSFFWMLG